ncbi:MAG TPA: response regulator [Thermomicrobiales bacterium]|nr:response regulator [Thermomicrobiales bacterium]
MSQPASRRRSPARRSSAAPAAPPWQRWPALRARPASAPPRRAWPRALHAGRAPGHLAPPGGAGGGRPGGERDPATPGDTPAGAAPILVVDDDPSIVATIQDILALEGYPVLTAGNGADALALAERVRPGLVLLDMRMPVLDGWGFARELRARGIAVPILVMTAAQNARRWAAEIEADGYVAKPFDLFELLDAVQRLRRPAED